MDRSTFLRLTSASCTSLLLASCASAPVSGQPVAWPPMAFASVRAFAYDCHADRSVSFFQKDGTLHRGILNGQGVLLTDSQTRTLLPTLTTATVRKHRTACYLPHHAFVFYDAAGRPIAHSEICFTCTIQRSSPAGLPEHIDFQSVWCQFEAQ